MLEMSEPTEKCCRGCWRNKPLKSFGPDKRSNDGLKSQCKECTADRARESGYCRRSQLKCVYGITPEQHEQMYADQEGRCAICQKWVPYRKIHTDHHHQSGRVRGLLCARCNIGLGYFGDTLGGLEQAVEYLKMTL